MKQPSPANLVLQIVYSLIGLLVLILIGGGIVAVVQYASPEDREEVDEELNNLPTNPPQKIE